jgi:hypothetical protein
MIFTERIKLLVEYRYLSLYLHSNSYIILIAMENEYITNQSIILLLAQRVKEYRLAARLSQKEMADSSLSVLAISRVEWREWTRTRSI